jgi:hypothetical protein
MVWLYLLTGSAYDRAGAAEVSFRLGSRDYVTLPTDAPASTLFEGVGLSWRFERSAYQPGQVGGASLSGSGSFEVTVPDEWIADGTLAAWLSYAWDGWAFTFERVREGAAYSTAETIAAGTFAALEMPTRGRLLLRAHDPAEDFARRRLALADFAGTGGAEGGAELANRPRPLVFGRVDNARAIPVDPSALLYQVHDGDNGGAAYAFDAVRDSGVALTSSGSNPPPAGSYYADLAAGELVLGDQPTGAVTVDIKGATASGVWKDTLSAVVRHIATVHGGLADPDDLDTASFAALATARPGVVGLATDGQEYTVAAALDALLGGAGGYWYFNRAGRLVVGVLTAPTATSATDPAVALVVTDGDIVAGSFRRTVPGIPPYEVRAQYRALGFVQTADELAGSVSAADRSTWSTPYLVASSGVSSAIQTAHKRSEPLELASWCYSASDAETVADALAAVLDGLVLVAFEVEAEPGVVEIGAEIWLEAAAYGFPDGVAAVVLGYAESQTGRVTIEAGIT